MSFLANLKYGANPFKRPSTDWLVSPFHYFLSILWIGGLAAFTVVTVLNFFTRPFAEVVELRSMTDALPGGQIDIEVLFRCEPIGHCGNFTVKSDFPVGSGCSNLDILVVQETAEQTVTGATLCPLPLNIREADQLGLQVDFTNVWNTSVNEVVISSPGTNFTHTVLLGTWQRKSLLMGVQVNIDDTVDPESALAVQTIPFYNNLQYDGAWMGRRATLRVALTQFATVIRRSRPGDLYGVLGEIGGFSGLIFTFLKLVSLAVPTKVAEVKHRRRRTEKTSEAHKRRSGRSTPRLKSPRGENQNENDKELMGI